MSLKKKNGGSRDSSQPLQDDLALVRNSPFLAGLMVEGAWRDPSPSPLPREEDESAEPFRRELTRRIGDPEEALGWLRWTRFRTLLELAKGDLSGEWTPAQLQARLRRLAETLVDAAGRVAEEGLRERYVHPLTLERRNIQPAYAICSISRLGSGDPLYTTGPAPVFIHSRAAEFAPALSEKDLDQARRSGKEWVPAREYFHRLARRTLGFLSWPSAAGRGVDPLAEDLRAAESAPLMPGTLVVLFSAFDEHFGPRRPVRERLALMRLRFLSGQERLGRAIEAAAKGALSRMARELGSRLRPAVNAWFRDRARAEALPSFRGSLLDIERGVRLVQFRAAQDDPDLWDPWPMKGLDRLAAAGLVDAEIKTRLQKAYGFQWLAANRLALLGPGGPDDWDALQSGRWDERLGLPDAGPRLVQEIAAARSVLRDLVRE